MIPDLKPYSATRDSGVPSLGEVPEHWEVLRLKNWLDVNRVVLTEDTDPDYMFDYLDIGAVTHGNLTGKPARIRFGNSPSRARRIVQRGDTLVSTVRPYLKAVWHAEEQWADLVASTGFAVLTPRTGTVPKFVSYFCRSNPFTNRVTAESVGTAYPAVSEASLGNLEVCVPPLPEQAAIARFLDDAERRIRCAITAKEKLIALLEEQKQAVIHQAVTGGLDAASDGPPPPLEKADPPCNDRVHPDGAFREPATSVGLRDRRGSRRQSRTHRQRTHRVESERNRVGSEGITTRTASSPTGRCRDGSTGGNGTVCGRDRGECRLALWNRKRSDPTRCLRPRSALSGIGPRVCGRPPGAHGSLHRNNDEQPLGRRRRIGPSLFAAG